MRPRLIALVVSVAAAAPAFAAPLARTDLGAPGAIEIRTLKSPTRREKRTLNRPPRENDRPSTYNPRTQRKPVLKPARDRYPSLYQVPPVGSPGPRASQGGVCRSECDLERLACEQRGAGAYQNPTDQRRAEALNCSLAVSSCLARC